MRPLVSLLTLLLVLAPSVEAGPRGATAEAVGLAGKVLYPAAAGVMATRHHNKPTRALSPREQRALRPIFGSLVERVRLTWKADPMDEWGDIQLGSTIGQTYGLRIYLREPDPGTWSRDTLALVIHEMVHSRQYEQVGGTLPSFGYHYFKNWALVGYSYDRHPMELEAERTARQALAAAWAIYASAREQRQEAQFRMLSTARW